MIERNAEQQVGMGLYFDRRRFIDRRVMFGRGNPTRLRLGAGVFYDLVHNLHSVGVCLRRAGENLNRTSTIILQSKPQQC